MTIELNIRKNAEEEAEIVKENATDPEIVTGQDHEAAPGTDADHVADHVTDTGKEDGLGHVHDQGAGTEIGGEIETEGTEVETEIGTGEEGEEKNQHHYHLNHNQERQVFDINTIYFSSVYPEIHRFEDFYGSSRTFGAISMYLLNYCLGQKTLLNP